MPAGEALVGDVIDEWGRPVANARVRVIRRATIFGGRSFVEEEELTSDHEGRFRCLVPPVESRELSVIGTARMSTSKTHVVTRATKTVTLEVIVEPNISGVVVDGAGKAVPFEDVVVRTAEGEDLAKVVADEGGRFGACVRTDEELVTVQAGSLEEELPLQVGQLVGEVRPAVRLGTPDLVLVLRKAVAMEGMLVDEDGKPLLAKRVFLKLQTGGAPYRHHWRRRKHGVGAFPLGPMAPGRWSAVVIPADDRFGGSAEVQFTVPGPPVRFAVDKKKVITGRVVTGGGSFTGGSLHFYAGPEWGRQMDRSLNLDDSGRFHLRRVTDIPYRLYLIADDFRHVATLEDVRPGSTEVVLRLVRGLPLGGVVNVPVGRASPFLLVSQGHVRFDLPVGPDGSFSYPPMLAPGTWRVQVYYDEPGVERPDAVSVEAGTTDLRLGG